ncbi:MAG: hypothetical protein M1818_004697 [Claussenomyces sp. TS43310]|nr:MAG: hypothetical protein M1818_004697 [Claussenomyces sp. TS43310]
MTPGSSCDCGHQACYHISAKHERRSDNEELGTLRLQISRLEESLEQERHGGQHSLASRLSQMEELVEKYKTEMECEVKTVYRGLEGLWQNVGVLQKYARVHEDRIDSLVDANGAAQDDIGSLQSRLIDLDDASMRLEDRIDAFTSPVHRSVTHPLLITNTDSASPSPSPSTVGAPQTWTVHISLLPTASQPFPFEKDTIAYKRCLSRGLHRVVAIPGPENDYFNRTVSQEFRDLLQGRPWMPLVAKLCDVKSLQGLPMLRQLPPSKIDPGLYDYEFLRRNCATVDPKGKILDLYIAMSNDTFSWYGIKVSKVYLAGLEACWEHDAVLDGPLLDDDAQSKACSDEDDKTSAGDLLRAWSPPATRLKRTAAAMSRTSSFDSMDDETNKPQLQKRQCAGTAVEMVERRAEAV